MLFSFVLLMSGNCSYAQKVKRQNLTPQSPEVLAALDKLCAYLGENYKSESRAGGVSLAALAYFKHTGQTHHQIYIDAIQGIKDNHDTMDIYSTGISLIFLIEYDPKGNRPLIDTLYKSLLERQKDHGGWGYPNKTTGDTSMTQYGVLSTWTALKAKIPISMGSGEKVAQWLIRTQDPQGCYGYQGTVSEKLGEQVNQSQTGLCMTAAGLGSTYIISDVLNIGKAAPVNKVLQEAIKPVDKDPTINYRSTTSPTAISDLKKRGNVWFDKNFSPQYGSWPYYYYYALERYESFRESVDGGAVESPFWYNEVANVILDNLGNGASVNDSNQTIPATAFAALFLMRSTKKAIEKVKYLGPGELVGGKGFPADLTNTTVRNGQVVSKRAPTTAEEMLEALSDPDNGDLEAAIDTLDDMPPEMAKAIMSETAKKIQALVSDPKPERRTAAVKALGKSGELDNVPVLLYALTDPDETVVLAARDSLCTIARKIRGGYGPKEGFSEAERGAAVDKWKAWFKSIRPDAELE